MTGTPLIANSFIKLADTLQNIMRFEGLLQMLSLAVPYRKLYR